MKSPDPAPDERLTIRLAAPADAAALSRLAQLDSAARPTAKAVLIAEIGGELRAALPLDGSRPIADPFHRTAQLVEMLATRARQLGSQAPAPLRRRWLLRPAPSPRLGWR